MADAAILYHSEHHGNTKKLLDAISKAYAVDLIDVSKAVGSDLSHYKAIGFASGVYMSSLHPSLFDLLDHWKPQNCRKAFVLYTSGSGNKKYADSFIDKLTAQGLEVLGVYHCRGYDTFGPFKIIGGIAKGHPDEDDIAGALRFYEQAVSAGI